MPEEREGPPLHLIERRLIERPATPSVVMAGLVPAIQIGPTLGNYGTTKDTKFKKIRRSRSKQRVLIYPQITQISADFLQVHSGLNLRKSA
jgi:hypothetical protein